MSPKSQSGPSVEMVPDGDTATRLVCPDCGYIEYTNPKIIVGAVVEWEGRILLCRRAIEPRVGFWTFPAGYLELNETTAAGASREVWEEAGARIEIGSLVGIYEIPRISQIYVIHGARMQGPEFAPGPESQAVDLFAWDDIPWRDIAFPSIVWGLRRYRDGAPPATVTHPHPATE